MKKLYSIRASLIHKKYTKELTTADSFKRLAVEFMLFVYEYFKYNGMLRRLEKQAKNQEKLAEEMKKLLKKCEMEQRGKS
jgi:hypothetical protein